MSKKRGRITPGLGYRLRQLREGKGLTREYVAEKAGIGVRYLAAIELGQKIRVRIRCIVWCALSEFPLTAFFIRNWRKRTQASA